MSPMSKILLALLTLAIATDASAQSTTRSFYNSSGQSMAALLRAATLQRSMIAVAGSPRSARRRPATRRPFTISAGRNVGRFTTNR